MAITVDRTEAGIDSPAFDPRVALNPPPLLAKIAANGGPPIVPLTVDQYVRMADAGILPTTPRVELLDGLLVLKDRRDAGGDIVTVGTLHVLVGLKLFDVLAAKLRGTAFHPRHQAPVLLPPMNAPEPDVSVVAGRIDDYVDRLPGAADAIVVIEVAYSSLRRDRDDKLRMYAEAGIPVYWIVNLEDRTVEVYRQPVSAERRYAIEDRFDRSGTLHVDLPDAAAVEVPVADFLPE